MGCNNSKVVENTQGMSFVFCWRKENKVVPINTPVQKKTRTLLSDNTARKTEQTVLTQLKEEGIVPKKGEGGVAFVLEISSMSGSDDSISAALFGVPEYKTKYPQYATYSQEPCRTVPSGPPRRLPPIDRVYIDAKLERARRNRERNAAERKAKWAKSYAKVKAAMEKGSDD